MARLEPVQNFREGGSFLPRNARAERSLLTRLLSLLMMLLMHKLALEITLAVVTALALMALLARTSFPASRIDSFTAATVLSKSRFVSRFTKVPAPATVCRLVASL